MTNPRNKGVRTMRPRLHPAGYIDTYLPEHPLARRDGYVSEHRRVAWDAGLLTDPSMHVHHRDHNKQNNALENLEVLSEAEHGRRHAAEDGFIVNQYGTFPLRESPRWPEKSERPCQGCDGTVPTGRRRDALYCSKACQMAAWKRRNRDAA